MKPDQIRCRRLELGLTVSELAYALNISEEELYRAEAGQNKVCESRDFEDAFDAFEERVFGSYVGA